MLAVDDTGLPVDRTLEVSRNQWVHYYAEGPEFRIEYIHDRVED
jgi:hypothetical protein